MSQEQQAKILDVKWYFVRLCINEFRGARSKFKKTYSHNEEVIEFKESHETEADSDEYNHEIDKMVASYNDVLKSISWYDRELFILYQNEYSLRKLSAKTKIPVKSIQVSINKTKQYVRENYVHHSSGTTKPILKRESFPDLFGN